MIWPTGKQLQGGKYIIQDVLGKGRFGITYLAKNQAGNLLVIKTPNDESLNRPDFERLQDIFVQEAFKLAKCNHPHIVKAKQPFREDGIWCIAMEYIDGVTLARCAQKILPENVALRYIQQIGEALIEVHRHNLLHRDIRPENIMVRSGKPEAVLIDFGLALEFDHQLTKTRTEEIAEGFAPLELYSRNAERGAYTDIYSLGATFYVLLTGETPPSATKRKLDNVRLIPPKKINRSISDRVNYAILQAMELEASDRPQSMREWLNSLGLSSPSSPVITQPRQFNWVLFWTALSAIAAILAAIGLPQLVDKLIIPSKPSPTSTQSPTTK